MKKIISFISIAMVFFILFSLVNSVFAFEDEYEKLEHQITELRKSLDNSKEETEKKEDSIESMKEQLKNIKLEYQYLQSEIEEKSENINKKEKNINKHKLKMDDHVASYYKNMTKSSNVLAQFLIADNLSLSLNNFFYHKLMMDEDKKMILSTVMWVKNIEKEKDQLTQQKSALIPLEKEIKNQSELLKKEIEEAKRYEIVLEKQIADLSQQQEDILNARSGSGEPSRVGEVPTTGDPKSNISFKADAPVNSYAVFSFGAYTHRNGMSQYGAKARAESGQTTEDILKAYFPTANINKNASVPETIDVQGYGTLSFTEYLYGIYEMPESWPMEVLKAQAVLARTYAMGASKPICTTEACQVYGGSPKTGAWKKAVDETATWVLENTPTSQYSSTTGGYTNTAGWDTEDGTNSGDWTSRAYESKAQSPWFYRAWYRKGYRDDSDSCGREHPWLSEEEMADIINAWIVRKDPNGADTNRIIPTTINQCHVGNVSGNPYSLDELREVAEKSGGAVTSISNVQVAFDGNGQTAAVTFITNRGQIEIPGSEFKETFNIRAPGYISIPQFGYSFFNIEAK